MTVIGISMQLGRIRLKLQGNSAFSSFYKPLVVGFRNLTGLFL